MDELYYLEEGFNPSELKVTQLRSVLTEHNVKFPSSAKKPQLIQLFEENISNKAKDLLREYAEKDTSKTSEVKKIKSSSKHKTKISDTSANASGLGSETDSATPRVEDKSIVEQSAESVNKSLVSDDDSQPLSPTSRKRKGDTETKTIPKKPKITSPKANETKSSETSPKISRKENSVTSPADRAKSPRIKSPEIKSPKSPRIRSPRAAKAGLSSPIIKSENSPKKSIFSDDEDDESFGASIIKSTPKVKPLKVTKPKSKKSTPKPERTNKAHINKKTVSPNAPVSVKDEEKDFDQIVAQIKKQENVNELPVVDLNLPSQLGVSHQEHPVSIDSQLATPRVLRSSVQPSPRRTPRQTPSRAPVISSTPRPKLIPINKSNNELSDSSTDEEEEEKEEEKEEPLTIQSEQTQTESKGTSKLSGGKKFKFGSTLVGFAVWLVVGLACAFGYWYHLQLSLVGYCGQEINYPTFPNAENSVVKYVGDYLDNNLKPECTPCPNHARCFPHAELACYEDFIEYKPWTNFIFPPNKKCIPDTRKAEKLEIMIDVALDLLRSKNAMKQCGKSDNNEEAGIKVDDLHDLLLSMKAPYITVEEFEELWERSIVELEKEPDIIAASPDSSSSIITSITNDSETTSHNKSKVLRSTSLSHITFKCQLKNSIVGSVVQYKYKLLIMLFIFSLIKYVQHRYNKYKLELIKVDIIYQEVLAKLSHQAKLSKQYNNDKIKPYIGSNQLRDLILGNENNLKKRVSIWNSVIYKVENNTNVSCKIIEEHGEIMKVWEWITDVE